MVVFKRTEGISTTDIVGRLLLMSNNNTERKENTLLVRKISGENEDGIPTSKL